MSRIPLYLKERIEEVNRRTLLDSYESQKLPRWEKTVITWFTLMIFWMIISASFHWQNMLIGGIVTFIVSLLMYDMFTGDISSSGNVVIKTLRIVLLYIPQYIFIMAFRLLESNLKVMKHAIFMDINPGIVKIDSDLHSQTGLTILANSITLTPGTLTIDTERRLDESKLYVHWIDVESMDRNKAGSAIKGDIEEWLKNIFW